MRFWLVLFFAKIYVFFSERFAKHKNDRIGVLAYKICPDFLSKIAKPKTTVMVTGTNGKSTTTHMVAHILMNSGHKTEYSYWGANMLAGHIKTLLDCVTIFNKPKVDACVLEADELVLERSLSAFDPQYLLITNICRDSIRRNAYPDYIFEIMDQAIDTDRNTTLLLHSNDPISSRLGRNNKRIFVGTDRIFQESAHAGFSNEFLTCPECNAPIEYEYRHYRHVGKYTCPNCGFTNYPSKYIWEDVQGDKLILNGESYHIISDDIFNLYNEIMTIALFREMDYSPKKIDELLKTVSIPETREGFDSYKGIDIYRKCGKGQNGTAPSIIFESIMKNKNPKELVLIMDAEISASSHATMTWLYDNDFELLADDSVRKIIITGDNTMDYMVRLLLAGVDESKLIICEDYKEAYKYLSLDDSDIYLICDIDFYRWGIDVANSTMKRLDGER